MAFKIGASHKIDIRTAVLAGASANTDIALTGIRKGKDALIMVLELATGSPTDRTGTTAITSDGNIQCTVDTTGDDLVVLWARNSEQDA